MILPNKFSHLRETVVSAAAAFTAIAILAIITRHIDANNGIAMPMLASMGASACLMFVIPHSPLAQPWPVFGGHLLSAAAGVFCSQLIFNVNIAAATAIAISIVVMHMMRCLHPPSAATALIAVLGGAKIHALGWQFCYEVVALNVSILVLLALVINQLIPNRRYPLHYSQHPNNGHHSSNTLLSHAKLNQLDFKWALNQMDVTVDVVEQDLIVLYELAIEHSRSR
jgi:CBS domain-containing membrane protein